MKQTRNRLFPLALLAAMALSGPLFATDITVDPASALTMGTSTWKQTEWESAANFESWTTSGVTSPVVAGGTLSGTSSSADPVLQRTNISGGPDLDLAFNDYVDVRIQLPAGYAGDVQLYFGVTDGGGAEGNLTPVLTGFSASRMVTLPNAKIAKDGAFHTYRIDMALEPWWRGKLNDLRIDPATLSGTAFAVDFVRIGDTGVVPTAQGMSDLARDVPIPYTLESKHFVFGWNDQTVTDVGMTAAWAKKNLRNAEEVHALYTKKLGYPPPRWTEAGGPYKINFTCVFDGNFGGGPMLNVGRYELRIDPPTWTIPHELMHVFQGPASGGHVPGDYYEMHANYGRELWLQHYQAFFPNQSGLAPEILAEMHMNQPIGRNYYETWPFYLYVDENPDNLPDLGFGTVARIWQQMAAGETNHSALESISPTSSIKDIIGNFARRGLTYNYASKASLRAKIGGGIQAWAQLTEVTQRPDDTSWWQVPAERAPQQAAYTIHELTPVGSGAGRVVSVNFRGLPNAAAGADWRACFIVIADDASHLCEKSVKLPVSRIQVSPLHPSYFILHACPHFASSSANHVAPASNSATTSGVRPAFFISASCASQPLSQAERFSPRRRNPAAIDSPIRRASFPRKNQTLFSVSMWQMFQGLAASTFPSRITIYIRFGIAPHIVFPSP